MDNNGWTVVRYGRRNQRARHQKRTRWGGATTGMARAFTGPSGESDTNFNPGRPVPPPRASRYSGPQSATYASVLNGHSNNPGFYPRRGPPRRMVSDDVLRQPADPQLGRMVRQMHTVIKMVHHLQNVAPKPGKEDPRMISRMVEILSTMIKPASPTAHTAEMIRGNAENWGYNTLTILMDHYKRGLDEVLEDLDGTLVPNWKVAFEIAVRWAKRNLPRLSRDAVDHAEALIAARVCSTDVQEVQGAARASRMTTAAVQTVQEPQRGVSIKVGSQTPSTVKTTRPVMKSTAMMTEPPGIKDSKDENGSPLQPLAPLEQRQLPRGGLRKTRGVPLREEDFSQREEELVTLQQDTGSDLIAWEPVVSPILKSTTRDLQAIFEENESEDEEVEEREEVGKGEFSTVRSSGTSSEASRQRPIQHLAQVHRGADPDSAEVSLDWSGIFSEEEPQRFQPRRHANTQRKLLDWDLVVEKKWVFIGDSNLSRMPEYSCTDLQIESFPGGHFRHCQGLMEKTLPPSDLVVEKIVLSFGINGRANKSKETTVKNLQGAIRSAKKKFPQAEVWVPLINYSYALPDEEQENLRILNEHIERNMLFIPWLPEDKFQTEDDDIHWTAETGKAMLEHWMKELNFPAP